MWWILIEARVQKENHGDEVVKTIKYNVIVDKNHYH